MSNVIPSANTPPAVLSNADNWITQAIEKDFDLDKLEQLLAMRARLKEEYARDTYYSALAKFQGELPEIPKTRAVYNKDDSLRYYFAPMGDIIKVVKKLAKKHGLSYTVKAKQEEGRVQAEFFVYHENGFRESTTFWVPIESDSYMSAPQRASSAMTYAKRVAFCNGLGIMTADGDDDAVPEGVIAPSPTERAMAVIYSVTREAVRDGIMTEEQFINAALGLEDFVDQHDNLPDPVVGYKNAILAKIETLRGDRDPTPDEPVVEVEPDPTTPPEESQPGGSEEKSTGSAGKPSSSSSEAESTSSPSPIGKPTVIQGEGKGKRAVFGRPIGVEILEPDEIKNPVVVEVEVPLVSPDASEEIADAAAKDVSPDRGKDELNKSINKMEDSARRAAEKEASFPEEAPQPGEDELELF